MATDINPYQSPSDVPSISPPFLPRSLLLRPIWVFVVGAVFGFVSFIAAIALIPADVPNATEHDLLLANYLGFIFPPLVGLWSGWMRRSWGWAVAGIVIGLLIGESYRLLCGQDFLVIMVAFPCLLGGAASMALGSGIQSWFDGIVARLGKGLVAGFVLGFVYMVVLNVLGIGWMPVNSTERYRQMMWHDGPIAMTAAGGFYLVLFVWASNLRWTIGRTVTKLAERSG